MRTLKRFFIALTGVVGLLSAQSPAAQASATIAGEPITIKYSSPSVRGRQIFGDGGVVSRDSTYPVWRAGEFRRVLRKDGRLLVALPARADLIELRVAGRDRVPRTVETFADYFTLIDQRCVSTPPLPISMPPPFRMSSIRFIGPSARSPRERCE
jgi:hypothetical protein